MNVRVEVVCTGIDGTEQRQPVMTIQRAELVMETLGMNLTESKALLATVQDIVVAHQVNEHLEQHRACQDCGKRHTNKDSGSTPVQTLFGLVDVLNPRWHRRTCQADGPKTSRPAKEWLCRRSTPEMLYLVNQESIRNHLQGTAERIERELGDERPFNLFEGVEEEWEQQPLPNGPMSVGIDGGYIRAAHKQGWFKVIAGKSVVAFQRDKSGEIPSAKCFGFVQTYDENPRWRLWELIKSQGLQENQQVVFMSDGGENVRRMQEYLHPFSEHLVDWFHITMRLTVLQQQTKGLKQERPQAGKTYRGVWQA